VTQPLESGAMAQRQQPLDFFALYWVSPSFFF
jgi:hypothetical protein